MNIDLLDPAQQADLLFVRKSEIVFLMFLVRNIENISEKTGRYCFLLVWMVRKSVCIKKKLVAEYIYIYIYKKTIREIAKNSCDLKSHVKMEIPKSNTEIFTEIFMKSRKGTGR